MLAWSRTAAPSKAKLRTAYERPFGLRMSTARVQSLYEKPWPGETSALYAENTISNAVRFGSTRACHVPCGQPLPFAVTSSTAASPGPTLSVDDSMAVVSVLSAVQP